LLRPPKEEGNVTLTSDYLFVCSRGLSVCTITQNVMNGFWWNFLEGLGMAIRLWLRSGARSRLHLRIFYF